MLVPLGVRGSGTDRQSAAEEHNGGRQVARVGELFHSTSRRRRHPRTEMSKQKKAHIILLNASHTASMEGSSYSAAVQQGQGGSTAGTAQQWKCGSRPTATVHQR